MLTGFLQWVYWIIQETGGTNTKVPIPHPIHLHGMCPILASANICDAYKCYSICFSGNTKAGHDFYVLGSGSGVFDPATQASTLSFKNPYRRDVTILPGGGWVVVAFPTDNPGTWLMHCHIAWHVSEGLAVQFLESKASIPLPAQIGIILAQSGILIGTDLTPIPRTTRVCEAGLRVSSGLRWCLKSLQNVSRCESV